jgi:hypothetical protein
VPKRSFCSWRPQKLCFAFVLLHVLSLILFVVEKKVLEYIRTAGASRKLMQPHFNLDWKKMQTIVVACSRQQHPRSLAIPIRLRSTSRLGTNQITLAQRESTDAFWGIWAIDV